MARKKSTATIESEISKTEAEMTKIQDRYNKLADKLKIYRSRSVRSNPSRSWKPTCKVAKVWMKS